MARVGLVFVGRREDQGADGHSSATRRRPTGSTVRDCQEAVAVAVAVVNAVARAGRLSGAAAQAAFDRGFPRLGSYLHQCGRCAVSLLLLDLAWCLAFFFSPRFSPARSLLSRSPLHLCTRLLLDSFCVHDPSAAPPPNHYCLLFFLFCEASSSWLLSFSPFLFSRRPTPALALSRSHLLTLHAGLCFYVSTRTVLYKLVSYWSPRAA